MGGVDDAIALNPCLNDLRFGMTYSASELVDALDRRVDVPDEATFGRKSETIVRATDQFPGHGQGDDLGLYLVATGTQGVEDGESNVTPRGVDAVKLH